MVTRQPTFALSAATIPDLLEEADCTEKGSFRVEYIEGLIVVTPRQDFDHVEIAANLLR